MRLPTLAQLRRTNKDVVLRWFARGRLWDSPEQPQQAAKNIVPHKNRNGDWRPGGHAVQPVAHSALIYDFEVSELERL